MITCICARVPADAAPLWQSSHSPVHIGHKEAKHLTGHPGYLPHGAPDNVGLQKYFCPVCGAQLDGGDTLAEDKDGDTVGCVYCIRYYEIWEKY